MSLRVCSTFLVCAAAFYACGLDATGAQDCASLEALGKRCDGRDERVGNLTAEDCTHALYYLSHACQGAVHTYIGCASAQNCVALQDPQTCLKEGQAMDVACSNGAASIVTEQNGRLMTTPRGQVRTTSDDAVLPTPWQRLARLPHN